jgi:molecular chaperone GrpE (heat shock protein)
MNDDLLPGNAGVDPVAPRTETLGASTVFRLCEEVIQLREKNDRQHKLFDQSMNRIRDTLQASFNSFAANTQKAYQDLRKEIHGEKKFSLELLTLLLEIHMELQHIMKNQPADLTDATALEGWINSVAIQSRKVESALRQHGIHEYSATLGTKYDPALHERVGSTLKEGMDPGLVAEEKEPGYASQVPDFKLVRAKVVLSE